MKIGIITRPNKKGQVVIPKKIRDELYITENTPLNLVLRDNGIYIYPIEKIIPKTNKDESFAEILIRTRGAWGKPSKEEVKREKQRHRLEILSSKKNKNAW